MVQVAITTLNWFRPFKLYFTHFSFRFYTGSICFIYFLFRQEVAVEQLIFWTNMTLLTRNTFSPRTLNLLLQIVNSWDTGVYSAAVQQLSTRWCSSTAYHPIKLYVFSVVWDSLSNAINQSRIKELKINNEPTHVNFIMVKDCHNLPNNFSSEVKNKNHLKQTKSIGIGNQNGERCIV